jgi:hypothetical protein
MDAAAFGLADAPGEGGESGDGGGGAVAAPPAPLREDMVENAVGFLVHPKVSERWRGWSSACVGVPLWCTHAPP